MRRLHTWQIANLGKTCGKVAQSLVTHSGHISTTARANALHVVHGRVKPYGYTHSFRLFFTLLSTAFMPRSAPVFVPVIRTFHSTYNNHHQMY